MASRGPTSSPRPAPCSRSRPTGAPRSSSRLESVTLWRLPQAIEDEIDARWEHWLEDPEPWRDVFKKLEPNLGTDLLAALRAFGLIGDAERDAVLRLAPSAEGRAVALPSPFRGDDASVTLLAAAFARGAPEKLAVPYARLAA